MIIDKIDQEINHLCVIDRKSGDDPCPQVFNRIDERCDPVTLFRIRVKNSVLDSDLKNHRCRTRRLVVKHLVILAVGIRNDRR